ncbi:hypothetical protein TNCV_1887851 [Trichonephila clavipes]|nr:hypothetical protein TNCV_1887851 [Trichonephila clavipes]
MKRPELGNDGWMVHQNNAPAHTALFIKKFITSKNITVIKHLPYSPDLSPRDSVISYSENLLKGNRFYNSEEVQCCKQNKKKNIKGTIGVQVVSTQEPADGHIGNLDMTEGDDDAYWSGDSFVAYPSESPRC